MTITREDLVRDIVAADFRVAAVFHRYGIPFCCGGDVTLAEACRTRGLDDEDVLGDLRRACARRDRQVPQVGAWQLETLIAYIVGNHHAYLRLAMPAIAAHTRKLSATHGDTHPELREVARLFEELVFELTSHMAKEENVLFPAIVALADPGNRRADEPAHATCGGLDKPVHVMEAEHAEATATTAEIRRLTGGYCPPPEACTTYRVCFAELEAFERDLRTHVHLEETALFPRALELTRST